MVDIDPQNSREFQFRPHAIRILRDGQPQQSTLQGKNGTCTRPVLPRFCLESRRSSRGPLSLVKIAPVFGRSSIIAGVCVLGRAQITPPPKLTEGAPITRLTRYRIPILSHTAWCSRSPRGVGVRSLSVAPEISQAAKSYPKPHRSRPKFKPRNPPTRYRIPILSHTA
jgi:hypothetical protein